MGSAAKPKQLKVLMRFERCCIASACVGVIGSLNSEPLNLGQHVEALRVEAPKRLLRRIGGLGMGALLPSPAD